MYHEERERKKREIERKETQKERLFRTRTLSLVWHEVLRCHLKVSYKARGLWKPFLGHFKIVIISIVCLWNDNMRLRCVPYCSRYHRRHSTQLGKLWMKNKILQKRMLLRMHTLQPRRYFVKNKNVPKKYVTSQPPSVYDLSVRMCNLTLACAYDCAL